jgi:diguanylate cyclase (GGDEF)-like protein
MSSVDGETTLIHRLEAAADSVRRTLPRGRLLPLAAWESRHRAIVILLWLHVIALIVFAVATGHGVLYGVTESVLVVIPTLVAAYGRLSRGLRSCAAAFGLVTASAVLVHLSGGYIEAHFHFFVVLGILSLYQDWGPFLLAVGYVVVHHAVVGLIDPDAVFNHAAARDNPLFWAVVHGLFVLAASAVSLVTWRFVERQSLHDPLTDLPNRTLFGERLSHAMARTSRSGTAVSVLFIDLDGFKTVNDRMGHAAGDDLLKVVADRIRGCLRAGDTAGRLGGDEFAVLVEGLRDPDQIIGLADRIATALHQPADVRGESVVIGASIGRATAVGPDLHGDDLLLEADKNMYEAKRRRADREARFGIGATPEAGRA